MAAPAAAAAAPGATTWTPDEDAPSCQTCANRFGLLTRRHHCRLCGQVICGDCSRTRASPPGIKERDVRLCVECVCELHAQQVEGLGLAPLHEFVHDQLTTKGAGFSREKVRLTTDLQVLQAKMRDQERRLFEQDEGAARDVEDQPHAPITLPSDVGEGGAKKEGDEASAVSPVATVTAIAPRKASRSGTPSPQFSPSTSPAFLAQMKSFAVQSQALQHALQELQIQGGLLVQVILQNINPSAPNQVWNEQHATGSNTGAANHQGESALNAGLYRYLLILPPPHRLVCMTSLLFPPTPSVFKKHIQPSTASLAIQNQLHSMNLPPNLLDAPIEAAREFLSVFRTKSTEDDKPKSSPPPPATSTTPSTPTLPAAAKVDAVPSDANEPAAVDAPTSSVDESPAVLPASLEVGSVSPEPLTPPSGVPSAPTPVASSQLDASSQQQNRMRFYGIRSLDSISSIRPLDFRSDKSGAGQVQRGFTINFHAHCAPTSAGLMDSITNRRDDDVIGLFKQSWNCIIVDDQLKRVQGRFQKALEEQFAIDAPELVRSTSAPTLPPAKSSSPAVVSAPSSPPTATASIPSPIDASSSSSEEPVAPESTKPLVQIQPPASPVAGGEPSTPTPAPTSPAASAPAPASSPSSASSFFSSIMSALTNTRGTSGDANGPRRSPPPATPIPTGPPPPPTAAQQAAAASAELGFQVQQSVVRTVHACSVGYFSALAEAEKVHVRAWMADMKTTVSWDRPEHHALLERLWASYSPVLAPTSPNATNATTVVPFPGPVSESWKNLGFQGTNPCSDFRGVGLLSLKVLVYLGERYPELTHVLMSLQSAQLSKPREYPLACAGINIVCAIINVLDLGSAPAASAGSSSASLQSNNSVSSSGGGNKGGEQGPTTALLANLNQTLSNVTAKLMNKDDGAVMLTPHQEHMASMWNRLARNRLFRLFVRNKARLGLKTPSSTDADGNLSAATFTASSMTYLSTVDSIGELVATLFPLLDDLWVSENAGYFEFNQVLRSIIAALEAALLKHAPRDMRALEQAIKAHLKQERLERDRQAALQAALAEKQREAAAKKHHAHTQAAHARAHVRAEHEAPSAAAAILAPGSPLPIAQPVSPLTQATEDAIATTSETASMSAPIVAEVAPADDPTTSPSLGELTPQTLPNENEETEVAPHRPLPPSDQPPQ